MPRETFYFIASPEAAQIIEDYFDEVNAAAEQTVALTKRLGAKTYYARGSRIVGFQFEPGSEPTDLKHLRRDRETPDMWVPAARYKKGKELRDEMEKCKAGPDGMELTSRLFGSPFALMSPAEHGFGMVAASPGVQKLNGQWVISVDRDKAPLGSTPLKRSEFWAMKEAEEAA